MTTSSGVIGVIGATFGASSGGGSGRVDGVRLGGPGSRGGAKDRSGSFGPWRTGPGHGTPGTGRICRWVQAMSGALSDA
ncbi:MULTISPECIES: hypothetical protein [unclassified Streptomyces]|uniref:hypothetical protein n=1 Tax=unclassified Streptomyces TaxID=2593676 RepID=UPI0033A0C92D